MSETTRPHDPGSPVPSPPPATAAPPDPAREIDRLRRQVASLEARLVKANAERDEVARELADVRQESDLYRHAVQELTAEDYTMTGDEFEAELRRATPLPQVLTEVEEVIREAKKVRDASHG